MSLVKINQQKWFDFEAKRVREDRQTRLQKIDSIVSNPFRWQSLDESSQKELADYRQELLDISEQPKFPFEVTWPEIPEILQ